MNEEIISSKTPGIKIQYIKTKSLQDVVEVSPKLNTLHEENISPEIPRTTIYTNSVSYPNQETRKGWAVVRYTSKGNSLLEPNDNRPHILLRFEPHLAPSNEGVLNINASRTPYTYAPVGTKDFKDSMQPLHIFRKGTSTQTTGNNGWVTVEGDDKFKLVILTQDAMSIRSGFVTVEYKLPSSNSKYGFVSEGRDFFNRRTISTLTLSSRIANPDELFIHGIDDTADKKPISSFLGGRTPFKELITKDVVTPSSPVNFYKNPFNKISKQDKIDSGLVVWEFQPVLEAKNPPIGSINMGEVLLNFEIEEVLGIYVKQVLDNNIKDIDPYTGEPRNPLLKSQMKNFNRKITLRNKSIIFNLDSYIPSLGTEIYIAYLPKSWGENAQISDNKLTLGVPYSGGRKSNKKRVELFAKYSTSSVLKESTLINGKQKADTSITNVVGSKPDEVEIYEVDFDEIERNSSGIAIQLLNFKDIARKNIQHTRGVEDVIEEKMIDSFHINTWGKAPSKLMLSGVIDKNMVHTPSGEIKDFQKVVTLNKNTRLSWTIEKAFRQFLEWNSLPKRIRYQDELRIIDLNNVRECIVSMNSFDMKISSDFQNLYVFSAEFDILEEISLNGATRDIPTYINPVPLFTPIEETKSVITEERAFEEITEQKEMGIETVSDKREREENFTKESPGEMASLKNMSNSQLLSELEKTSVTPFILKRYSDTEPSLEVGTRGEKKWRENIIDMILFYKK